MEITRAGDCIDENPNSHHYNYYNNDIVCRKIPGESFLFGRVDVSLAYKNGSDVYCTEFKIHWYKKKGQVYTSYPNSKPPSKQFQFHMVDRDISLGTQVIHNGLEGKVIEKYKIGYVQKFGKKYNKKVIWEINADKLYPIERNFIGHYIFYKNWIGIIVQIKRELIFITKDEEICSYPTKFKSCDRFAYYCVHLIGAKYKLDFWTIYKTNWSSGKLTWLSKLKSALSGPIEVTLLENKINYMEVKWMGLSCPNYDSNLFPMPSSIFNDQFDFKEFQYIDLSPTEYIKKGSRLGYQFSKVDTMITFKEWKKSMLEDKEYKSNQRSEIRDEIYKPGEIVEVIFVRNVVTIQWNNGTMSQMYAGLIDKLLNPYESHLYKYSPTFVIHKMISKKDDEGYGFVKSYNTQSKTYVVDWYHVSTNNNCKYYGKREISCDLIEPHPIFQKLLHKGQIVIKSSMSKLKNFEVGVVSGVYNGQILVYDYYRKEIRCSPTDLIAYDFISTWDESWFTYKKFIQILISSEGIGNIGIGTEINRIDNKTTDLICGTRRFIELNENENNLDLERTDDISFHHEQQAQPTK